MHLLWVLLTSVVLSARLSEAAIPAKRYYDTHTYYALEHRLSDFGASLDEVAEALGVQVVERAGELQDVWLVRTSRSDGTELETRDEELDPVISAFEVLQGLASSHHEIRSEDALFSRRIVDSVNFLERQTPRRLVKRAPPPIKPRLATSAQVAKSLGLKDPNFSEQWHLVNDEYPEHMMNTTPVWDLGFTGRGVLTSFLDDGLDFESEDLKDAFVCHWLSPKWPCSNSNFKSLGC
jgi:kexin